MFWAGSLIKPKSFYYYGLEFLWKLKFAYVLGWFPYKHLDVLLFWADSLIKIDDFLLFWAGSFIKIDSSLLFWADSLINIENFYSSGLALLSNSQKFY